jgi:hypothetical protein
MVVKCANESIVRIQSVEEAEMIVADMERVIRELKATIELIKQVSPAPEGAVKMPVTSI